MPESEGRSGMRLSQKSDIRVSPDARFELFIAPRQTGQLLEYGDIALHT